MAIKCDCVIGINNTHLTNTHVVLSGYQELDKATMIINTVVFRSKQDYLDRFPSVGQFRHLAPIADIISDVNFRTGIYTWLMQQPEFTNSVADMSNDFPVTPI